MPYRLIGEDPDFGFCSAAFPSIPTLSTGRDSVWAHRWHDPKACPPGKAAVARRAWLAVLSEAGALQSIIDRALWL